jgi:DNA polymerase-3 subunit delta'
MNDISSLTNTRLYGHKEAQQLLLQYMSSGTMPHGLLISGPKGIGKATLAYHLARYILSSPLEGEDQGGGQADMPHPLTPSLMGRGNDSEHPVFRRVAAASHSDFLVVEPLFDAKKDEFANEISVEQARKIAEFLSLTPGESEWRVVIVDAIDQLNANAANSILKILEEPPPQALLILISHNPGLLLPTIRSRCQQIKLKPLSEKEFAQAAMHVAPHVPDERLGALSQLAGNSPGLLQELETQGALMLYGQILDILGNLPELSSQKIHGFADQLHQGQTHANWKLFSLLMLRLFERVAKTAAGMALPAIHEDEAPVLKTMAAMFPASVWAAKWQQAADQFSLAQRLHLDYKQVLITFFHTLPQAEGLQLGHAA